MEPGEADPGDTELGQPRERGSARPHDVDRALDTPDELTDQLVVGEPYREDAVGPRLEVETRASHGLLEQLAAIAFASQHVDPRVQDDDGAGNPDYSIEHTLLAALDSYAATAMESLVRCDRVLSHLKKIKGNRWRHNHILSPRGSVRFAMFAAAQAVRSPAFREYVTRSTGSVIERTIQEHYGEQVAAATSPEERAHLEYMSSLRVAGTEFDQSTLPRLSAQLVYELGQVLYHEYSWSVHRFDGARPPSRRRPAGDP